MKIKLYFDKGNLGRLAVAMIFAAVLFWKIGFSVWALPVFGACYFLFKSLEVELSEKIPWGWTGPVSYTHLKVRSEELPAEESMLL